MRPGRRRSLQEAGVQEGVGGPEEEEEEEEEGNDAESSADQSWKLDRGNQA